MSETLSAPPKSVPWFQIFKYSVYSLLVVNLFLFLREDWQASAHIFTDGIRLGQLIEGFAATIDTASWVALLLVFELETWVISDDKLKGGLRWTLGVVKLLCYAIILYAFYGYVSKYMLMHTFEPSVITDLCAPAASGISFLTTLDEFAVVTADNCAQLAKGNTFFQLPGRDIVASLATMKEAQWLTVIDVVNAGNWILIVGLLALEIRLQMKGRLGAGFIRGSVYIKGILYTVLLVCAILWGIDGDFLDFWDAFLWIVSFAFIELNLFEWNAETEGESVPLGVHSAKG